MSEAVEPQPRRRRGRAVITWLPALVLVPATLVVAVNLTSAPTTTAMDRVSPLAPGTTWVYDVFDHGEPSGTRVRQVKGTGLIEATDAIVPVVRIASAYDDYPGRGAVSDQVYVGVEGDQLLQYGLITRTGTLDLVPPAPAYQLPTEVGTSWTYSGKLGDNPLRFETEVTDRGDVEVGGHTFTDCTEWTAVVEAPHPDDEDATEVVEEWTCPGVGVVKFSDIYEAGGAAITEELREFRSPDRSWTAEEVDTSPIGAGAAEATFLGFDQQRTFAVPEGTLSRELAWTEARGDSSGFAIASDGQTRVIGEPDGLVDARDVTTGEQRWQVSLPRPIVAAPVLAGDVVLVADGRKNLWALSIADGSARWVHQFDDMVSVDPVVSDEVVAVAVDDGSVHALRLDDGEESWSARLPDVARTPPARHEDTLIVGAESGALTAFDLGSGERQWSVSLPNLLDQGPTVAGDRVLAVDGNGVISAYDAAEGTFLWQSRGDFPVAPLAVGADTVVSVGAGDQVDGYDLDTGSLRWSADVAGVEVAPAVIGDEVVVVGRDGRVTVLALSTGTSVGGWDLAQAGPSRSFEVLAPPSLVGDSLVISAEVNSGDVSSMAYAYPVSSGAAVEGVDLRLERRVFLYPASAPPVQDGATTYALDIDGTLFGNTGEGTPTLVAQGIVPPVGFGAGDGVVVVPDAKEVHGLNGSDGSNLWTFPSPDAAVGSLPTVADGTAYVPLPGLGLVALEARTGDLLWTATLIGATGTSSPLALPGGDIAYAANGLARFDGRTGKERWRLNDIITGDDLRGAVAYSPISHADGNLYAILVKPDDTQPSGELARAVAVDADSGELLWQRDLEGSNFAIGAVGGDGMMVVVDGTGTAHGLDGATGEPRWSFRLGSEPAGAPVVHDGVVALVERGRPEDALSRDFRIVYLDVATGRFAGSYEPPNGNDSIQPTVGSTPDGTLLIPSTDELGQVVLLLEASR